MAGNLPPGVTGSEDHFNPPTRTTLVCKRCDQMAGLKNFNPCAYGAHPTPDRDTRGYCDYHGHHDEFREMEV